ncbi:hypothetical protein HMPREF9999_01559, partial [Alloprevotella sp. oral taxon 473 str. F0040]
SIHAAQAGCDLIITCYYIIILSFQFTQPKRAATRKMFWLYEDALCFNSRSPSGLRLGLSVKIR